MFKKLILDLRGLAPIAHNFAMLAQDIPALCVQVIGNLRHRFTELHEGLSTRDVAVVIEIAKPPPSALLRRVLPEKQLVNLTRSKVAIAVVRA